MKSQALGPGFLWLLPERDKDNNNASYAAGISPPYGKEDKSEVKHIGCKKIHHQNHTTSKTNHNPMKEKLNHK